MEFFSAVTSKARIYLLMIISMLLITDITIILNIPFLREITSFLFFTVVPGILVLQLLGKDNLEFLKKILLSIGLSVSILIFMGLILNSLYPFLIKPLSLGPVLVSLNILVIAMALSAYLKNKDKFMVNFFNLNFKIGDKLTAPIIFPVLFPLLAVLGTYLMNTTQNNILLMLMLFLIPLYLIAVVYLRDRIHPATYPIAVWLIGLSLLLMHGLTSAHVMGRDVHSEFYCYQLTLANLHWNIQDYYNPYNACLSINILPVVYHVLSNMGGEYIFKLFFSILGSLTPLIVYVVSKKYIGKKYAFFAALLFTFQIFFIYMLGASRQEIGILFFFLAVMVIFDPELENTLTKKVLFLLFMFSLVVSHYTTSYVAFIIMATILIVPFLRGLVKERKLVTTNFDLILISLIFIVAWYLLFAKVQFTAGAQVIGTTAAATAAAAGSGSGATNSLTSSRGAYVLGILGIVLKSVPNTISVIVHDAIFATIMLGFATVAFKYRKFREKMDAEYLMGVCVSIILLVLFVALPYISIAYDAARLFFQVLIFVAPLFVIGAMTLSKIIKKPKWDVLIILVLLISIFSCATYMQYHFYGTPYSPDYDANGTVRGETYLYDSELTSVSWLNNNKVNGLTVYSDGHESSRFELVYGSNSSYKQSFFTWDTSFFALNKTKKSGYIYLGYVNVKYNQSYDVYDDISVHDMSLYSHLFKGKYRIYDNGGSQIWL